jgi:hypothetical protein
MPILNRHSMEIPQIFSTISRENDVLFFQISTQTKKEESKKINNSLGYYT